MNPLQIRKQMVDALRLDMIGPEASLGSPEEILPEPPSRWYLTGFIVPLDADDDQKADEAATDELDVVAASQGLDDSAAPETAAARRSFFPSSIGLSFLVGEQAKKLKVLARWGDYNTKRPEEGKPVLFHWQRTPHNEPMEIDIPAQTTQPVEKEVPGSRGLKIAISVRPVPSDGKDGGIPKGTRSVSLFLVNRRDPSPNDFKDESFAFQAQLEVHADVPFIPRPNLRSLQSDDWDERVADLQYQNDCEFAVGHSVATEAILSAGECRTLQTCWIPQAEVERVAPSEIKGVELSMDALSLLKDSADVKSKLGALVTAYRTWLNSQKAKIPTSPKRRRETAEELLKRAKVAANRIEQGIALLNDPVCLEAFRIANRGMAEAARRRMGVFRGADPATVNPTWRPFQLAFLLMNLPGIANPTNADREVVDLLFFPTGGGKTEAYLGLSAFTLVLRRLRNPGVTSAGLSVLMRYTLRLLTLDQLSRAATLICALELERQQDVTKLGEWPFEIGLWVGQAATPNRMGNVKVADP